MKQKEGLIFLIEDIKISESFSQVNESIYQGDLTFKLKSQSLSKQDSQSSELPFTLFQNKKKFGHETLIVWEVKLGGG